MGTRLVVPQVRVRVEPEDQPVALQEVVGERAVAHLPFRFADKLRRELGTGGREWAWHTDAPFVG